MAKKKFNPDEWKESPAALSENLFHDNAQDIAFLESTLGRQAIISLHIEGIIAYIDEYYRKDWSFID